MSGVKVRDARCMLTCGSPVAVSLTCPGKMSYLFADVQAEHDLDNLLALVRLYVANPGGIINDARPIGRLRHCLKGRLPAPLPVGDETNLWEESDKRARNREGS